MKNIAIITILALFNLTFGQPHPSKERNREKIESKKEYKIAQKKAKMNEKRYKHEANDRKKFGTEKSGGNNM